MASLQTMAHYVLYGKIICYYNSFGICYRQFILVAISSNRTVNLGNSFWCKFAAEIIFILVVIIVKVNHKIGHMKRPLLCQQAWNPESALCYQQLPYSLQTVADEAVSENKQEL